MTFNSFPGNHSVCTTDLQTNDETATNHGPDPLNLQPLCAWNVNHELWTTGTAVVRAQSEFEPDGRHSEWTGVMVNGSVSDLSFPTASVPNDSRPILCLSKKYVCVGAWWEGFGNYERSLSWLFLMPFFWAFPCPFRSACSFTSARDTIFA